VMIVLREVQPPAFSTVTLIDSTPKAKRVVHAETDEYRLALNVGELPCQPFTYLT